LWRDFFAATSFVPVDAGSALGASATLTTNVGGSSAGVSLESGSVAIVGSMACWGLELRTTGSAECEAGNDCPLAARGGASADDQRTASAAAPANPPTAALAISDATPNRCLGSNSFQPKWVSSYRPRARLHVISPRAPAVRTTAIFSVAVPGRFRRSSPRPRCLSMASMSGPWSL